MPDEDTRLPLRTDRDDLPPDAHEAYDAISASRDGVRGPFAVLLHSPPVADRVAHLGAYLRFEGILPDAVRELAILTTARHWACAYEWAAHEDIARDAGVPDHVITAVRDDTRLDLDDTDAAVNGFCRSILTDGGVPADTFDAVRDRFGDRGVIELLATVGYYSLLAFVLNACRVRPDAPDPFA